MGRLSPCMKPTTLKKKVKLNIPPEEEQMIDIDEIECEEETIDENRRNNLN